MKILPLFPVRFRLRFRFTSFPSFSGSASSSFPVRLAPCSGSPPLLAFATVRFGFGLFGMMMICGCMNGLRLLFKSCVAGF
ncbi:hypothetical protein MtrunA17_Chr5g0398761 [Medicago truncatula]|uniref:Transmembrane protein n=1 Tax=Medicago truncatula TaxID=3880 RepID=A0A396HSL1_MEDTR|nr:hypothetical protein MtrunA17_Chr5g0398761 [Medicago truncatula]